MPSVRKAMRATPVTSNKSALMLTVARDELDVLEKLADGVASKIRDFSKKRRLDGKIDHTEFSLNENKYSQLKAYEELAHACYGRTVKGVEVDDRDKPKGAYAYRITQANVGYVDGKCIVIARNSPLATALVTALPTDSREITTKNRDRYLDVSEVRVFDGPVSLLSHSQPPNFRSATVRTTDTKTPVVLRDLRSIASSLPISATQIPDRAEGLRPTTEAISKDVDPAWLADWSDVFLPESDETSLGHQFFIQTTLDQERALNNPHGLTFVEGIAGSGKTSVALGRLKFFANFATGEREHYGLQNAPEGDFSPVGMVGFVLSPSLKRYLKDTAAMLHLERLPIRDFEEFRIDMCGRFGVSDRFKRRKGELSLIRSRVDWLRAMDAVVARAAGSKLRKNLMECSDVPPRVADRINELISELLRTEPHRDSNRFNLDGLAARIADSVADAELRTLEEQVRERFRVRQKIQDERYRREKAALEREMQFLQRKSERKILSPLMRSLLTGISSNDLVFEAVASDEFPDLVLAAFGRPSGAPINVELKDAIAGLRQLLAGAAGRLSLSDGDLVNLVVLGIMIAEGFEYVDQRSEFGHLRQIRKYTAVFIDEVQDFAENELVLMGMVAAAPYHQITLSGDRKQRLQAAGSQSYDHLFPKVPRAYRNKPFFLDHNFRQRPELAAFSSGFKGAGTR